MPDYEVTDPKTGKTLVLTGDAPPTEAELLEVFSQFEQPTTPASAAQPTAPRMGADTAAPWSIGRLGEVARQTAGPGIGALKGAANTLIGAGKVAYDNIPGVSAVSDFVAGGNAAPMFDEARRLVQPVGAGEKAGYAVEQIGEFFLPVGASKAKLAKLATETAKSGVLTQLQTGDPATSVLSAGITAGMPVAGKVAGAVAPMIRKSAENTMARALGATKELMKSEAAELAPEMLARGVKGSRQAMLAQAEAKSREVGQRLGALYDEAGKAGQTVSGLVVRGELEFAKDALMTTNKAGVKVPIEGAQGVVKKLDRMASWVESLGDDINVKEASRIKTVWDRIVAKAGLYGPKAAASATDNEAAWAIREGAGSFRQLLSDVNPDISALNREYAFWKGLQDVLKATELRTQAQQGRGLLAAIGGTTGFFSGDGGIGERLANAGGGAVGAAYLAKALQSAPFRTRVTGPFKHMFAKALASGNDTELASAIRKVVSTLPSQARQALAQ